MGFKNLIRYLLTCCKFNITKQPFLPDVWKDDDDDFIFYGHFCARGRLIGPLMFGRIYLLTLIYA